MQNTDTRESLLKKDCKVKPCKSRYVSMDLASEVAKWHHDSVVFIDAPTGAGKTRFVKDVLAPCAMEKERNVVLFSNRVALNLQQKRSFGNTQYVFPDDELKKTWNIGNVIFYSYQQIGEILKSSEFRMYISMTEQLEKERLSLLGELNHNGLQLEEFEKRKAVIENRNEQLRRNNSMGDWIAILQAAEFVVFDEAHFFLSDARFNNITQYLLGNLLGLLENSTRIYMSATLDEAKPVLQNMERSRYASWANSLPIPNVTLGHKAFEILEYNFPRRYRNNYMFSFFIRWNEMICEIIKSDPKEKWLIFVKSLDEGNELKKQLTKMFNSDSVSFVHAGVKGSKEFKRLCSCEKFNERFLISTNVIDNGVNINDPTVKHVVIHTYDRISAVQMAGRRRLKGKERINLYIKLPEDGKELSVEENTTINLKNTLERAESNSGFIEAEWGSITVEQQKLFLPIVSNSGYQFWMNGFAKEKLIIDEGRLSNLSSLYNKHDPEPIASEMLKWFDQKLKFTNDMMISVSSEDKWWGLIQYIEKCIETKYRTKSEDENIIKEMKQRGEKTQREKDYDEFVEICKRTGIKRTFAGAGSNYSDINAVLKDLELPYVYKRSEKAKEREWWFERKDTSEDTEADIDGE